MTAREQAIDAVARALYEDWRVEWQGRNPERIAPPWEMIPHDYEGRNGRSDFVRDATTAVDALLTARLSTPCPECRQTGHIPYGKDFQREGRFTHCEPCKGTGRVDAGPLLLGVLVDTGQLEPITMSNDDGAGGQWRDADGNWRSYSKPSTTRVVGYRVASVVPVPEDGESR